MGAHDRNGTVIHAHGLTTTRGLTWPAGRQVPTHRLDSHDGACPKCEKGIQTLGINFY